MKKTARVLLTLFFCILLLSLCKAEEEGYGVSYDIPYYFQWDPRWGAIPYGTGVIASTGCGPTCLSMVVQYLTNNLDYTPEYIAEYAEGIGCYVPGKGTAWALFTDGETGLDVEGNSISVDGETWRNELTEGRLIILSMGPGEFTNDGHFIVLRGYNAEGFLVNDPNSPDKSQETWDEYTLTSQAAGAWSFSCVKEAEIRFDLLPDLDEETIKALMEAE